MVIKCFESPELATTFKPKYDIGTTPEENRKLELLLGAKDTYSEYALTRDTTFSKWEIDAMINDLNNPLTRDPQTMAIYQKKWDLPSGQKIGVAFDKDGRIVMDEQGRPQFKNLTTGEDVDVYSLDFQKGEWTIFGRKKDDTGVAVAMPLWLPKAIQFFYTYLKRGPKNLGLTKYGLEQLEEGFEFYIAKILSGDLEMGWEKKFLSIIVGEGINRFKFFNAFFPNFNHILTNATEATRVFGIEFKPATSKTVSGFRQFAEEVANRSGHNIGAKLTVYDTLSEAQREYISSNETVKWMREDGTPFLAGYSRSDFEHMTFDEGYEIIKRVFPDISKDGLDKFSAMVDVKIYGGVLGKLDYFFRNVLQPSLYMLMMGFGVSGKARAALTSINAMLYFSDAEHKSGRGVLKGDWSGLMKRHGMNFSPYIDWLDWTPGSIGSRMLHYKDKLKNIYDAGFFNISDAFFESDYYAKRLSYYFQTVFPFAKSVNDVEQQLDFLKKLDEANGGATNHYRDIIEDAYSYSQEAVRLESTNTYDYTKNKVAYATESLFHQKAWNILTRSYNFMMGWARAKTRGAIQTLSATWTHFRTPIERQYLEMLADPSKTMMDLNKWRQQMIIQNEDIVDFFTKMQTSAFISRIVERTQGREAGKEDKDLAESFMDVLGLMANFNGNLAAFTLLPERKMFYAFARNIFKDVNNDGRWDMDFGKGLLETSEVFLKTMTRGFWIMRGMFHGVGDYMNDPGKNSLAEFATTILEGISSMATGYSYFLDNDIKNRIGYSKYIPQASSTIIYDLIGLTPKEISDYRDLYADWQKDRAFNGGFKNYLLYHLPFLAEYNRGAMSEKTFVKDVLDEMYASNDYKNLIRGVIPEGVSQNAYEYLYNIATAVNLGSKNKLDEQLHTEFKFEDGKFNSVIQTPEDIWNTLMAKKIDPIWLEDLRRAFGGNMKTYEKSAMRMLGYLEAREPGTSALALAYLMSHELSQYKLDTYGDYTAILRKGEEELVKGNIARKYAPFFFEADKHRVWSNFMLRVMKENPDLQVSKLIEGSDFGHMKIKLRENSDYGDRDVIDAYKMNLLSHMMAVKGDYNAHKIGNLYASVFKPTKDDYDKDGTLKLGFSKRLTEYLGMTLDRIDTFGYTNLEKDVMKMGVLYASFPHVSNLVRSGKLDEGFQPAFQKLTHHLWGTLKEIDELALEQAQMDAVKATKTYSGRLYTTRYPQNNKALWESVRAIEGFLRDMAKKLTPYKDFKYRNSYGDNLYYSKPKFESLLSKGTQRENITFNPGSNGFSKPSKGEAPGGFTKQFPGYSRPKGGKTEDPDKTFDFQSYGRLKRLRTRIAKVKSLAQNWRRVNKLGGASDSTKHRRQRSRKSKRGTSS